MFSKVGLKMGETGGNKNIQSSDVVGYLVAETCPTLYDLMDCSPPGSSVLGISPGKNTGVGCHFLLLGIFLTQGSNKCLRD